MISAAGGRENHRMIPEGRIQPSGGGGNNPAQRNVVKGVILMRQEAEKGKKMCVGKREEGFCWCPSSFFSSHFEGIGSFHLANV